MGDFYFGMYYFWVIFVKFKRWWLYSVFFCWVFFNLSGVFLDVFWLPFSKNKNHLLNYHGEGLLATWPVGSSLPVMNWCHKSYRCWTLYHIRQKVELLENTRKPGGCNVRLYYKTHVALKMCCQKLLLSFYKLLMCRCFGVLSLVTTETEQIRRHPTLAILTERAHWKHLWGMFSMVPYESTILQKLSLIVR